MHYRVREAHPTKLNSLLPATSSFLPPPVVCPARTRRLRGTRLFFLLRTLLLLELVPVSRVFSIPRPLCHTFLCAVRCAWRNRADSGFLCWLYSKLLSRKDGVP